MSRSASAGSSRMASGPRLSVRSISFVSRPTSSHQRRSTWSLWAASCRRQLLRRCVPGVRESRDRAQGLLLPRATDEDGQPRLDRRRVVPHIGRVVPDAACGGARGPKHAVDQLHGLVQPVQPLADAAPEVDAEGGVLRLEPGAAQAQHRPTPGEVVEGRDHLDHERRVAERVGTHQQPQRRAGGHLAPAREHHVALEDRPGGRADDGVQVIPGPQRVVAQAVGRDGRATHRGPVGVLVPDEHAGPDGDCDGHATLL